MSNKLNIGVVGLGRLGALYASYFLGRIANARLVAVSDVVAETAEKFASEHDVPRWYQHYQDLLADKEVDAVVIVTPTSSHKDVAIAAAQADKAVFCEKPLSISLDESLAIKAAVAQTGIFFHLGFMRRYDKGYAAAQQKIAAGEIGTPIVFKSTSRDPFRPSLEYLAPEHSGGLLVDCGIHDMDLARWLMGEVRSVYSIGDVLAYPEMKPIGDVDNAVATLTFASGALGVIDLSRSGVFGYDIRTEILGTQGTLQIGYLRETPLLVLTKNNVAHDTVPYFMERFGQAYVDQLQNFVDHVRGGQPPAITCDDGIAALRVSLAATQSLHEQRPVTL
ncbi:MAG: inositol 2-dehydrogenase [Acidobacteria bacterium]|nr:inositol 2-dehydrogenase [Acidobacteriota bacterium]MBI3427627.1 inositol 2-dehydrogenase [Acidobacteriota bacterium]